MARTTTPSTAHKHLERLRGTWSTRGEMLKSNVAGKTFRGKDTYAWLPGDKFLLHSWNVQMPDGRKKGIEVIGFDRKTRGITSHSFDSDGNASRMKVQVRGDEYRLLGDVVRFSGRFNPDGTELGGLWELKGKKGWEPWMQVTLTTRRRRRQGLPARR